MQAELKAQGGRMTITDPRVLKMIGEWDEKYGPEQQTIIEQLRRQPCAACGSLIDVAVIAYGSIAKLTPMCRDCRGDSTHGDIPSLPSLPVVEITVNSDQERRCLHPDGRITTHPFDDPQVKCEPKSIPLRRIDTRDTQGLLNGYVVPIWRADSGERISQVYLTVVLPGTVKGPHLHKVRTGRFTCIKGSAEIITRGGEVGLLRPGEWTDGIYFCVKLMDGKPETFVVPPGVAAEIRCLGNESAYLLNMPDPAWSAEDPDEWPVEDWNPCV